METAADKFVALARRAGFAFSGLGALDHTLVRHVYDLSRMNGRYDLGDAVAIALETMTAEAATRGRLSRLQERSQSRGAPSLRSHGRRQDVYRALFEIVGDLVYGDKPAFDKAFEATQQFAESLRRA